MLHQYGVQDRPLLSPRSFNWLQESHKCVARGAYPPRTAKSPGGHMSASNPSACDIDPSTFAACETHAGQLRKRAASLPGPFDRALIVVGRGAALLNPQAVRAQSRHLASGPARWPLAHVHA